MLPDSEGNMKVRCRALILASARSRVNSINGVVYACPMEIVNLLEMG